MKLSKEWLEDKSACSEGIEWLIANKETDATEVLNKLIEEKKLNWANWLIVRVMSEY